MKPEDITAWALNELSPEERAAVEAELAAEPQGQQKAQATKNFCALLSEHLVDPEAEFTPAQRESLKAIDLAPAKAPAPALNGHIFQARAPRRASFAWKAVAALAACVLLTLFVGDFWKDRPAVAAASPSKTLRSAKDVTLALPQAVPPKPPAPLTPARPEPAPLLKRENLVAGTSGNALAETEKIVAPGNTAMRLGGLADASSLPTLDAAGKTVAPTESHASESLALGDAVIGTVVGSGAVVVTSPSTNITLGGSTIRSGDIAAAAPSASTLTINSSRAFDVNGTISDSGIVSGTTVDSGGSLGLVPQASSQLKDVGQTLTLSNNNAFTGTTTVNAGTARTVESEARGTLALGSGSATATGAVGGVNGTTTNSLSMGGASNYAAFGSSGDPGSSTKSDMILTGGISSPRTATSTASAAPGNTVTINGGGTLDLNGTNSFSGTITSGGNLAYDSNALGFVKSGAGTLTLSGVNTYTGGTTVSSGTLALNNDNHYYYKTGDAGGLNGGADTFTTVNGATLLARTDTPDGLVVSDPTPGQRIMDAQGQPQAGTARYARIHENPFQTVASQPLSTFSLDVDTASYSNVRRFLNAGYLPPPDAVRLEEMINYFPYDYEMPSKEEPFSVHVDLAEAPWAPEHRLARICIKGRDPGEKRPQANFVFLIDVSGSMDSPERLPLVKQSLELLTEQLQEGDRVSIVTYAGACQVALPNTDGSQKQRIMKVIHGLHAGGSTNGESGIRMAYEQSAEHFIKGGINRVILCTDGDFNVGMSSPEQLRKLVKEKAKGGTFLSVLGFGTDNLQDRTMEVLADNGNGNYAYIDSLAEARKVLVEQMRGTLITIAKDVKVQVEFNPSQVASYRLIGYEKRMLATKDFNDDKKDAGEIGAGHTVTALYEIVPAGLPLANGAKTEVDELRYQPKPGSPSLPALSARPPERKLEGINDETMTVKLRYKEPDGQLSKLIEAPVHDAKKNLKDSPADFRFATAVAEFGMLLRRSEHAEGLTFDGVRKLALSGKGQDALGYRGEFIQLVDKARGLAGR